MRRKLIIILLVLLMAALSGINAYADTIMPRYSVVSSVDTSIFSTDDGIGFTVIVHVPSSTALDSVWMDAELRSTAGTVAATFGGKKFTKHTLYFDYEGSSTVTVSGTYFVSYEIRCYKDGEKVDTPTGTTATLRYTA